MITLRAENDLPRILVMVSQYDHCLVDLSTDNPTGKGWTSPSSCPTRSMPCHRKQPTSRLCTCRSNLASTTWGGSREPSGEIIEEYWIDAVVLARYMQILSDGVNSKGE